jgi:hypothetical protein
LKNNQDISRGKMDNHGGKRKQSGRKPGVPNKANAAVRTIAGEYTRSAIETLAELMENKDTPAAARISAAKELLERGNGKSGSYSMLELETPLSELQPKEAIGVISDSMATGAISLEDGQRLIGMVETRIKAIELEQIDARITEVEKRK